MSSRVQGEVPGPRSMCLGQTERAVMGQRLCGELLDRFGRLRLLASQQKALRCRRYCFGGGLVVSDARRGCWCVNDSTTATIVSRKETVPVVEHPSQAALTGQRAPSRLRLPERRFRILESYNRFCESNISFCIGFAFSGPVPAAGARLVVLEPRASPPCP